MAGEQENVQDPKRKGVSQIIITLEHEPFTVTFGGNVANYDAALAMLEIAKRHFESLLAAARVSQVLSAPGGVPLRLPTRH